MKITCLHTADAHVATFGALFAEAGLDGSVEHIVRADLLSRARGQGICAVRDEVQRALTVMTDADAVLCTCSTLGPLIDDMARTDARLLRIDRPLMEHAVAQGDRVLVAICLESTRAGTLDLLKAVAAETGRIVKPSLLLCVEDWPLFEAGRSADFARAIADRIRQALADTSGLRAVVLGQASMAGAAAHLTDVSLPVLSSPKLAVDRAIKIARS